MKKISRVLFLSAFLLIISCSFAYANDVQSAEPIELNIETTCTLTDYSSYYYKFIPSETGQYQIDVLGELTEDDKDAYIFIYDEHGDDILGTATFDEYHNRVWGACKLIKGRVYYIKVNSLAIKPTVTVKFKISKHEHVFKDYSDTIEGLESRECYIPHCYYTKYNFTWKPSIKKLTGAKKSFSVYVNNKYYLYSGLEIQCSTNKKFTSAKKVKNLITYQIIKGLKKNTKYYVRARVSYTYYTGLDDEKETVYSSWSPVKTVKTK